MKHTKKILSLLLALLLVAGLLMPIYSAEGEVAKLSMKLATATDILVGDTATVTVEADRDFTTRGSGMTVYYDASVLAPDMEASSAAAPFAIHAVTVKGKAALRISFLPTDTAVTVSAAEPLATLKFKTIAMSAKTAVVMDGAYLYDETLAPIGLEKPKDVTFTVARAADDVPVTGITLDKKALTLEEGDTAELTAAVAPADASNAAVIWTSSNEKIATVSDGTVKAVSAGVVTVTATTADGGFKANCTVTVKVPDAGYTVKMPEDMKAVIGETVQLPVVIGNKDGKTGFNAFDIDFTYDNSALELVSTKIPNVTVTVKGGKINVLGYGESKQSGSVPFTLEFKVLKEKNSAVKITEARVDNSGNAAVKNASLATAVNGETTVTVAGYAVTLPEGFTGGASASPDQDYTFSVPKDYFDYTVKVTVDGKEITVTDNGDGTYTIPKKLLNGKVAVEITSKTGKIFKVTLGTDMTGKKSAQHGVDYKATIDRDEEYEYTVSVTIGGKAYTGYRATETTYTIPGEDIIGNIIFTVVKKELDKYPVTFTGSGAGAAQGNKTSAIHGKDYTFTLKEEPGYTYQVSYKMGGRDAVEIKPDENGKYTIKKVTGKLEIIIEKIANMQVSVHSYLTLGEETMYLVMVKGELANEKVFSYDSQAMYYSQNYGLWVYPVVSREELDVKKVETLVKSGAGTRNVVEDTAGDVDISGQVTMKDAQLVQDLYEARYTLADKSAKTFLRADVNQDKKLDMMDVAAVIYKTLKG